jgi:drug/metabolite transporter (DMT)-like permease
MLTAWGTVVYFIGMKAEQSSIVIMMMQMTSVIILIISYSFLGERISLMQFIGFCLVLFAGISLSISKGEIEKKFQLSKAFWVIMAGDLMWATAAILFDYVSVPEKFLATAAYEGWGIAIGGMFLYLFVPKIRNQFHTILKDHRRGARFVMLNESFYIIAKAVSLLAIALGPVSLVSVLGSTEVFFGLLFASLLSLIVPHIFKEDLNKKSIVKKTLLSLVLFAGLWLVQ